MTSIDRKASPLLRRDTFSSWVSENVRFSDTDMIGHVNNAAIAIYCETGRTECVLRHISDDPTAGFVFVMARISIDFLREAHWPARVDIGTGMLSVGNSSFVLGQGLFIGDDCIATSEAVSVVIDPETRKPCAIPDAMRARMNQLLIASAA